MGHRKTILPLSFAPTYSTLNRAANTIFSSLGFSMFIFSFPTKTCAFLLPFPYHHIHQLSNLFHRGFPQSQHKPMSHLQPFQVSQQQQSNEDQSDMHTDFWIEFLSLNFLYIHIHPKECPIHYKRPPKVQT